jgi:hypothetical protein
MWNKKKFTASCSECQARLPAQADACTECGYPVTSDAGRDGNRDALQATALEYKLVQLLGAVVFGAGVIAAVANSLIAASVAITIGGATYLSGLMGAWWNSGD